jgi:hypothetical protein
MIPAPHKPASQMSQPLVASEINYQLCKMFIWSVAGLKYLVGLKIRAATRRDEARVAEFIITRFRGHSI